MFSRAKEAAGMHLPSLTAFKTAQPLPVAKLKGLLRGLQENSPKIQTLDLGSAMLFLPLTA